MEMNLFPVFIKFVTTPHFHMFTSRRIFPQNLILTVVKNILSKSQLLTVHNTYVTQLNPVYTLPNICISAATPPIKSCPNVIYAMKGRSTIYGLLWTVILPLSPLSELYSVKDAHC